MSEVAYHNAPNTCPEARTSGVMPPSFNSINNSRTECVCCLILTFLNRYGHFLAEAELDDEKYDANMQRRVSKYFDWLNLQTLN